MTDTPPAERPCSKCGAARDRRGQRYCRKCHAANMRNVRAAERSRIKTIDREVKAIRRAVEKPHGLFAWLKNVWPFTNVARGKND